MGNNNNKQIEGIIMDNHGDLKLGKNVLSINVKCGEVIGQQKWSETEVHSSGGGGHVGPQGGSISTPTITSTSKTKQEFWIREDDGRESSIELTDSAFTAMEGQRIWLAVGGNKNSKSTSYLFAYNSASDTHFDFIRNWIKWLYSEHLLIKPFIYRLLTTWLSFSIGVIFTVMFFPLMAALRTAPSFSIALNKVIESFSFPESIQHAISYFPHALSANPWTLILIFLGVWLISSLILRTIGYLLFLKYWENNQLKKMHKKIYLECRKLAGDYSAPKSTSADSQ